MNHFNNITAHKNTTKDVSLLSSRLKIDYDQGSSDAVVSQCFAIIRDYSGYKIMPRSTFQSGAFQTLDSKIYMNLLESWP